MSEPERLADILPAVTYELAVMCAAEHPLTGDLCPIVGPHSQHSAAGEDPWATTDTRKTA